MKNVFLTLAVLIVGIITRASDTLTLSSTIKHVTVFFSKAQVNRTASLNLSKGKYIIKFDGLPYEMEDQSIQINQPPYCDILSVKHRHQFPNNGKKNSEERALDEALETLKNEYRIHLEKKRVYETEYEVLMSNSKLSGGDTKISAVELKSAADFYRIRLMEILEKKEAIHTQLKNNLDEQEAIQKQLNHLVAKRKIEESVVFVTLECLQPTKASFSMDYIVPSAGWTPQYDFKVTSTAKPLTLGYNAQVFQSTGEDWDKVKLTLSTGNPQLSGEKPILQPWYFEAGDPNIRRDNSTGIAALEGYVYDAQSGEPIPFSNIYLKQNGKMINGTSSDEQGRFLIKPLQPGYFELYAEFVGFEKFYQSVYLSAQQSTYVDIPMYSAVELSEVVILEDEIYPSTANAPMVMKSENDRDDNYRYKRVEQKLIDYTASQNILDLSYSIKTPYSIPSDGSDYLIKIKKTEVPVSYTYEVVPKVDTDVFLSAAISDWEDLDLLAGKSSVYVNGMYTGESSINPDITGDTLYLSLGRDKNIVVKRTANKKVNSKSIFGSNVKEVVGYDIELRNNNTTEITVKVVDQIPITQRKEITIDELNAPEAKHNVKTGELSWLVRIPARQTKKVSYSFEMKYPK
jgi:hypothetical protein